MKEIRQSERGQILILLVLVLIGLLAFTALAIDGGMVFADRRYLQGIADTSSISGAGMGARKLEFSYPDTNGNGKKDKGEPYRVTYVNFECPNDANNDGVYQSGELNLNNENNPVYWVQEAMKEAANEAVNRANSYDYTINDVTFVVGLPNSIVQTDQNRILVGCYVETGTNIQFPEKSVDVRVILSNQTQTSFVHLVNNQPVRNRVDSMTRISPRQMAGAGYAIVSLSKQCGQNIGGTQFSGNPLTEIIDGGVFSNSCIETGGTYNVDVSGGSIEYNQSFYPWDPSGTSGTIDPLPAPVTDYHPMTDRIIPPPKCPDLTPSEIAALPDFNGAQNLGPGNYGSIRQTTANGALNFSSGLYCIYEEITVNGGTFTAENVTIYFAGNTFSINGNVLVTMSAPTVEPIPLNTIMNVLIYVPMDVRLVDLAIAGMSGSTFSGMIYAPNTNVKISGNSSVNPGQTVFNTSIVAYDIDVNGTPGLKINYDDELDYSFPSYFDVQK